MNHPLPPSFVVHKYVDARAGYALYRWVIGGNTADGMPIHSLRSATHSNLYYNIITVNTLPINHMTVYTKKSNGHVVRQMQWFYTGKVLSYGNGIHNIQHPIIRVMPASTILPVFRNDTFIPLVQPPLVQPNPVPVPVPIQPTMYTINTIPQHAVRIFLTHAVLEEELCSITGEAINITNGAVTTCFHMFEKNAIAKWLAMPNSQDKCPMCNTKCNMFTMD